MSGYEGFSESYDKLTFNIDYKKLADYIVSLFEKFGTVPKLCLDAACGTGSLAVCLSDRNIEVIGADSSPDMLMIAQGKTLASGKDVVLLNQAMSELDLYGTVDGAVCTMDSVNHIIDETELLESFKKIALFLESGSLFIFDVNTLYKHREVLSNNTFVYDLDDIYAVWQNQTENNITTIMLDIFSLEDGAYFRSEDEFCERFWNDEILHQFLEQSGFSVLSVFGEYTFSPVTEKTERAFYIAKRN